MQWRARGLMHIASGRVLSRGTQKDALFALAPLGKLEDAKARVIVQLKEDWSAQLSKHPKFEECSVLSLDWGHVESLTSVLPQFSHRLGGYGVRIGDFDFSEQWETWLLAQGSHERTKAIQDELGKLGFNSREFIANTALITRIVGAVVRPGATDLSGPELPSGWANLIRYRDAILRQLRVDGFSDRLGFLAASLREITKIYSGRTFGGDLEALLGHRESGWALSDLSPAVLSAIQGIKKDSAIATNGGIDPLVGAIYLRLYDELFYGQQDWHLCFSLLRFTKYSLDSLQADVLTVALFGSFPAEEIRSLNLQTTFYSQE